MKKKNTDIKIDGWVYPYAYRYTGFFIWPSYVVSFEDTDILTFDKVRQTRDVCAALNAAYNLGRTSVRHELVDVH